VGTVEIWGSRDTRVWVVKGHTEDRPILLSCMSVSSLSVFPDGQKGTWVCGYCGSLVKDALKCPQCNAPRRKRVRKGTVGVWGYLPDALFLGNLPVGFSLEVLWGHYGNPADYEAGHILVRLEHCKIIGEEIPGLGRHPYDESNYSLQVAYEVECDVKFLPDRNV